MHIAAKMPAAEARTPEERERVFTHGPDEGYFYISQYMPVNPKIDEDGVYDFKEAYLEGLRMFMDAHPRVTEGRMSEIIIR